MFKRDEKILRNKPAREVEMGCCKVESVISIDEKGQMVLPKEIREEAGIRPGDKLAVVSWKTKGKVCCISLMRADDFADKVRDLLGPMIKEIRTKK